MSDTSLDGSLDVSLINAFEPAAGDSFRILIAGTRDGMFTTTAAQLPALPGDLLWQISYGLQTVTLEVVAPALAGDYDGNGIVDAVDYTVWRNSLGAPAGTLPNDTDGGVIGAAQYDTWKANFGNTANGAILAETKAVPEPAGSWLLILSISVLCLRRYAAQLARR